MWLPTSASGFGLKKSLVPPFSSQSIAHISLNSFSVVFHCSLGSIRAIDLPCGMGEAMSFFCYACLQCVQIVCVRCDAEYKDVWSKCVLGTGLLQTDWLPTAMWEVVTSYLTSRPGFITPFSLAPCILTPSLLRPVCVMLLKGYTSTFFGSPTSRELLNPTALCIDPNDGSLLVCDTSRILRIANGLQHFFASFFFLCVSFLCICTISSEWC